MDKKRTPEQQDKFSQGYSDWRIGLSHHFRDEHYSEGWIQAYTDNLIKVQLVEHKNNMKRLKFVTMKTENGVELGRFVGK